MKIVTFSEITGEDGVFIDGDWVESKDQDPNGDVRLIQLADIGDGWFINKSNRFLKKETAKKLKCTFLKSGDILIARMPDPLGRACIFPGLDIPCVTVVDVCIIRPDKKIVSNEWLKFLINSYDFRNTINQYITGTTRLRISRGNLAKLPFKLPILQDQIKIANQLTEAENLITQRKESILMLDELLKSSFLEMFGDPVKNEKGWEKGTLKSCTTKIGSGSTPRGGKETYLAKGISLIRSLNVYDNYFSYRNLAFISDEQANALKNVSVEEKDVLFNITGASVCRCTVVPTDVLPARVNQHVSILRPIKRKLNSEFLSKLLISENIKIQLLSVGSAGGAIMQAITKDQLEKFEIPLPPIDLQNQFATIVEKVKTLKTEYQKSLVELENLFGVLSQKAFKGEIVESEENQLDKKKDDTVMDEESDEIIDIKDYSQNKKEKVDITNMTFADYVEFPEEFQIRDEKWMSMFLGQDEFYQFLLKDTFKDVSFNLIDIETKLHDFFYHGLDMDFDNEQWRAVIFQFMKAEPPLIVQKFEEDSATIKLKLTDEAYKA